MAAVAGLPSSHVFELENETRLDKRRKAALPFARKLTRTPEAVGPEDIKALSVQFSDKQIVQLVFAICHFNTMNRLADAFGVPLEKTNVFAAPPKKPAPEAVIPPTASPAAATAEPPKFPAPDPAPAPPTEPAPQPK